MNDFADALYFSEVVKKHFSFFSYLNAISFPTKSAYNNNLENSATIISQSFGVSTRQSQRERVSSGQMSTPYNILSQRSIYTRLAQGSLARNKSPTRAHSDGFPPLPHATEE